ncbi:hypothetical protein [Myxococcus phage Mx1]|nr:hypothetical protein [Myxococcus phage Mx1]
MTTDKLEARVKELEAQIAELRRAKTNKKPWEQNWTAHTDSVPEVRTDTPSLHDEYSDPYQIGEWFRGDEELVQFIAAAPDMARALIGLLDADGHIQACGNGGDDSENCSPACLRVRLAVYKAGIEL